MKAAKILFRPKKGTPVSTMTDAQWISAHHGAAGFDNGRSINDNIKGALRCKSSDLATPRRVAGQLRSAEFYYTADTKWTARMLEREQERRFG